MARVVFVSELPKCHKSGVASVSNHQSKGLRDRGHEVFHIFPGAKGDKSNKGEFFLCSFRWGKYRFAIPTGIGLIGTLKLCGWLTRVNPEVIHFHGLQFSARQVLLALRIIKLFKGGRIRRVMQWHTDLAVYTRFHAVDFWPVRKLPEIIKRYWLAVVLAIIRRRAQAVLREMDLIFCPNSYVEEVIRGFTNYQGEIARLPSQVIVFPLLSEKEKGEFQDKFRHHRVALNSQSWPLCLTATRVSRVKTLIPTIILWDQVVKKARQDSINGLACPILAIIGKVEDEIYFQELTALIKTLDLENMVFFTGEKTLDEVAKFHQCAVMEVYTTISEVQCMSVVEAMIYGAIPIVIKGEATAATLSNPQLEMNVDGDHFPESVLNLVMKILTDQEFQEEMRSINAERSTLFTNSNAYFDQLEGFYGFS